MVSAFCFSLLSRGAHAETYWALHPTPPARLRELDPDRPDVTEAAHTVDAGHLQWETDLILHRREADDQRIIYTDEVLASVVKWGLTERIDAQLLLEPLYFERERGETSARFGRWGLRSKINLWGNDGGPTAMAAVGYARFEQGRHDLGVLVPLRVELPAEFKLGLQVGLDALGTEEATEMVLELQQSISLNRSLVGPLGAFVELVAVHDREGIRDRAGLNGGLHCLVGENLRFDVGGRFAIAGRPEIHEFFLGAAVRR